MHYPGPLAFARQLLIVFGLLITCRIIAQQPANQRIHFRSGAQYESLSLSPIRPVKVQAQGTSQAKFQLYFLQFDRIPGNAERASLLKQGISLLEYIPERTYLATVAGEWDMATLRSLGIRGNLWVSPKLKMDPSLSGRDLQLAPVQGDKRLVVSFLSSLASQDLLGILTSRDIRIRSSRPIAPGVIELTVPGMDLDKLGECPEVTYVEAAQEMKAFNSNSLDIHGSSQLHNGLGGIGPLSGKGVMLGIGDNGSVYHIDNRYNAEGQTYNGAAHATHVAGTFLGAGILNPARKGHAFGADFMVELFNDIIFAAPDYYRKNRMVITNNSYGAGSSCLPYSGQYTGYCKQADQQLMDYPSLMHVFAAGNSGWLTCSPFPQGYRTIDNAYQAAKNVITVGGTDKAGTTNAYSRGPVLDGRIKPEIAAVGDNVLSTLPGNSYGANWGTSMASPQVAGTLGLLYEYYRLEHQGQDPESALMKAILCNTATDIGNKGVDYSFGFGWLNGVKALEVLKQRSYKAASIGQGEEQVFEILLDREVRNFKIMLYWHDLPASLYSLKSLVNDLDIEVVGPDGVKHLPQVLDTSAAGVSLPAMEGEDHINNIEQVVLDIAMPGRYQVRVKGYQLPFGNQRYHVVHNWDELGLRLRQPAGGESWKPGERRLVAWEDFGRNGDNYELAFSPDNGATWVNVPLLTATNNRIEWLVPNQLVTEGRLRIRNLGSGQESISPSFSILPEISFTLSSSCEEAVQVRWKKVAGMDSAAVLVFDGREYREMAAGADTIVNLSGLNPRITQWITVQPILKGVYGERSIAKSIKTLNKPCTDSTLNGDIGLVGLDSVAHGRDLTSSSPNRTRLLALQIRNYGSLASNDSVIVTAWLDGNLVGRDSLLPSIDAGKIVQVKTRIPLALSAFGKHLLVVEIAKKNDPRTANNRLERNWNYYPNDPITLPFTERFNQLKDTSWSIPGFVGLDGAAAWDYVSGTTAVSLRTSPSDDWRGLRFLGKTQWSGQQLIATYNLSAYQVSDNIRLSLGSPDFGNYSLNLWVRGSDTSKWVFLPLTDSLLGYAVSEYINISKPLQAAGQSFSSSFQLRFDFANNNRRENLRVLDSLSLFKAGADLGLVGMEYNKLNITDGDSIFVRFAARNRAATAVGPFTMGVKLPNGQVLQAAPAGLEAGGTVVTEFRFKVEDWPNAVAPLIVWVNHPEDANATDDSLVATLAYARLVRNYPYVEGFENGKGGWGSSRMYDLSGNLQESLGKVKAANGTSFWGTKWLTNISGVEFLLSAGFLVSPLYDLSGLKAPHLSFSLNRQLCDDRDSVYVEWSSDTGRTWKRLMPNGTSTNWYGEPDGFAWKGCGKDFWHGATIPVPSSPNPVMFRIFLRGRSQASSTLPKQAGGLLVDDVHIYDLLSPIKLQSSVGQSTVTAVAGRWNDIVEGQEMVMAVKPKNGVENMKASVQVKPEPGTLMGWEVIGRSWSVLPGREGLVNGRLRLYFTDAEAEALLAGKRCAGCAEKISAYDMDLIQYYGPVPTTNHNVQDNLENKYRVFKAAQFDLIPYANGYYAEVETGIHGEFYLGIPGQANDLDFNATQKLKPDAVLLDWSVADPLAIAGYELEKAILANDQAAPAFNKLTSIQAGSGSTYQYNDDQVKRGQVYQYRLKLSYKNGGQAYSPTRTISFIDKVEALVFPNPSSDGRFELVLKNAEGKRVDLRVFDANGKLIWQGRVDQPAGRVQVSLDLGGSLLASGVYLLRIDGGGEPTVIRLVKANK
ncbi:S8 family serine peptidase [Flavihumibacter rivuli]|uniref:S8 family serine peptidase n=1 Tax=Flavihumibacter rivuli TaxID=2838156 RepID=UPI001BDE2896|nr:S8 family serine peptidase [Flavihumibacter rivuli]ULQ57644.1 S8 family serine peptidase [Flavihumibacter rivuli]